jgi:hypothetical protein
MRRLKGDWATHGRQYNIRPIFEWKGNVRGEVIGWSTDLCRCFDLTNREALRFKDTPTGHKSNAAFRKQDGYHELREFESRNVESDEPVRGSHKSKRVHQKGTHPVKICCGRCGFYIKTEVIENGSFYARRWAERCEACEETEKRKTSYHLNGVLKEFDKKPA